MKRGIEIDETNKVISESKKTCNNALFNGLLVYIFPSRFGRRRLEIFETLIKKNGGTIYSTSTEDPQDVSHLITEESIDKETILKMCNVKNFPNANFLKCTWLTACKKLNCLAPISDHIICDNPQLDKYKICEQIPGTQEKSKILIPKNIIQFTPTSIKNVQHASTNLPVPTNNEASFNKEETVDIRNEKNLKDDWEKIYPTDTEDKGQSNFKTKFIEKFACAHSSSVAPLNLNEHIINELSKLSSAYESRKDTWGAVGYKKAIAAIKSHSKKIETWEEAKSIRGVGERLADKIKEILESGELRKAKEICQSEETKALQLFIGVWGAGPSTANNWYTQGFRTLDDLRHKATLTRHQEVGLKYYDELNERMCRSEVKEIGDQVISAAAFVKEGLEATVCGSYRRGKPSCGDVDVLITHPDGVSHQNIFMALLDKMKSNGFLTDDLVIQENNGNQQKYLGVCKLPGEERKVSF
ncbi:UNVERIFIED_CONTAM: hypothetical protein GTU68_060147 [Idotea baltica]|nr:hypothetical protein [Idotea baltica]